MSDKGTMTTHHASPVDAWDAKLVAARLIVALSDLFRQDVRIVELRERVAKAVADLGPEGMRASSAPHQRTEVTDAMLREAVERVTAEADRIDAYVKEHPDDTSLAWQDARSGLANAMRVVVLAAKGSTPAPDNDRSADFRDGWNHGYLAAQTDARAAAEDAQTVAPTRHFPDCDENPALCRCVERITVARENRRNSQLAEVRGNLRAGAPSEEVTPEQALETERTMHAAWRKRAEEAELKLLLHAMEDERMHREPMPCKECGARTGQPHAIICDTWFRARDKKTEPTGRPHAAAKPAGESTDA